MASANCPSCGAPVKFASTISLVAVCSHCRTGFIRKDLNLETFGKVAELQKDKSRIQLGVRGQYKGIPFGVVGRVQMKYDAGTWNEWCLSFQDGRFGWMGESMGNYSVSFQSPAQEKLPTEDKLEVGANLTVAGKSYTLTNIEEAAYFSAEGELPAEIPLGEASLFVDLSNSDGGFATLDYSETPPLVFVGEYVPFEDFKFQGLKEPGH